MSPIARLLIYANIVRRVASIYRLAIAGAPDTLEKVK
jgi:hypothetical protein